MGEDISPADITEKSGICPGFIGPHELSGKHTVLFDSSLRGAKNLVCGANKKDYHYIGLNLERDCENVKFHDFARIRQGGLCPHCGKRTISISRGIEVGNIFQLGTKYTKAMGMQYLDGEGELNCPVMGCYGIGIGRLAASICEEKHDDNGPIWPISVAPWQVHICCLRADNAAVKAYADSLYDELQSRGIEVIYDDRTISAGVMFADADLLGVPLRIIVSPRNLKGNCCELATRDKSITKKAAINDVLESVTAILSSL